MRSSFVGWCPIMYLKKSSSSKNMPSFDPTAVSSLRKSNVFWKKFTLHILFLLKRAMSSSSNSNTFLTTCVHISVACILPTFLNWQMNCLLCCVRIFQICGSTVRRLRWDEMERFWKTFEQRMFANRFLKCTKANWVEIITGSPQNCILRTRDNVSKEDFK